MRTRPPVRLRVAAQRPREDPHLGRNHRKAAPSRSGSEQATIVLPVHPFRGVRFQVVRLLRGSLHSPGVKHVELLVPGKRVLRVPVQWTDMAMPDEKLPLSTGNRVSTETLLSLARIVEAHEERNVAERAVAGKMPSSERMVRHRDDDTRSTIQRHLVGAVHERGAGTRAQRVGDRGPAAPAGRSRRGAGSRR